MKSDDSSQGRKVVLEEQIYEGWQAVAFAPRFLKRLDECYKVNELQLLSVVCSIKHFYTIYTDALLN